MTVAQIRPSKTRVSTEPPGEDPVALAQPQRITIACGGYECTLSFSDLQALAAATAPAPLEVEMKTPDGGDPGPSLRVSSPPAATATSDDGEVIVMEMQVPGGSDPGPTITVRLEL
jgi:hypothetical protein